MRLTATLADRVAARMRRDGFSNCDATDVWEVETMGTIVSRDEGESLASRILQEFDELGIEVGS